MPHESEPNDTPAFGTTPITNEALHDWMESGHGLPEPEIPATEDNIDGVEGGALTREEERATWDLEHTERFDAWKDKAFGQHLNHLLEEMQSKSERLSPEEIKRYMQAAFGRGYILRGEDNGELGDEYRARLREK